MNIEQTFQHEARTWTNDDFVKESKAKLSRLAAVLYLVKDNEEEIKMVNKRRRPTMRHVSRTALRWTGFGKESDPKIHIKYFDSKNQFANILTKGSFARDDDHDGSI